MHGREIPKMQYFLEGSLIGALATFSSSHVTEVSPIDTHSPSPFFVLGSEVQGGNDYHSAVAVEPQGRAKYDGNFDGVTLQIVSDTCANIQHWQGQSSSCIYAVKFWRLDVGRNV